MEDVFQKKSYEGIRNICLDLIMYSGVTAQPNGHQKCHIVCYQTFERSMEEHLLNLLNCSVGLVPGMVGMCGCGN